VPSAEETRKVFGVDLYGRGVQPVWVEIENKDDQPVWFLPSGIDPMYYTPLEAAFVSHFYFSDIANVKMNRYFFEKGKDIYVQPGDRRAGFVFTNLDEGSKTFAVDLVGEDHQGRIFTFFIPVPGLKIDHHAFMRAGWDQTETITARSAWKTGLSFLFGGRYRHSLVSALYVFGRRQDAALQKARGTIHERNHLRLWLSPATFQGKPVWVGQISRDIGVRFSTRTIVTHKIDPDVDETRSCLIQDLLYSQGLLRFALVRGVGVAPIDSPRFNLGADPYFTDGLRAVLWVSSAPVALDHVEFVEWEMPAQYSRHSDGVPGCPSGRVLRNGF